jgi:hypothetical protein
MRSTRKEVGIGGVTPLRFAMKNSSSSRCQKSFRKRLMAHERSYAECERCEPNRLACDAAHVGERRKKKPKAIVQQEKRDANQAMHAHPRLCESTSVHIQRIRCSRVDTPLQCIHLSRNAMPHQNRRKAIYVSVPVKRINAAADAVAGIVVYLAGITETSQRYDGGHNNVVFAGPWVIGASNPMESHLLSILAH